MRIWHGPSQLHGVDSLLSEHAPQHQVKNIRMKPLWVTNDGREHGDQFPSLTLFASWMIPGLLAPLRLGRIRLEKGLCGPVPGASLLRD